MKQVIPGINIQWPWSELLLSGKKTIETRTYPLPEKFRSVDLAIIETPGPRGKVEAGISSARIVGTIRFSDSFQYKNKAQWSKDINKHQVAADDPLYGWSNEKDKWAWIVESVRPSKKTYPPPKKRGIIFANGCELSI